MKTRIKFIQRIREWRPLEPHETPRLNRAVVGEFVYDHETSEHVLISNPAGVEEEGYRYVVNFRDTFGQCHVELRSRTHDADNQEDPRTEAELQFRGDTVIVIGTRERSSREGDVGTWRSHFVEISRADEEEAESAGGIRAFAYGTGPVIPLE